MAIFVTGDTHGSKKLGSFSVDGFMPRLNTESFPEQKSMSKDDFVVILGDFGGIWNKTETKEEAYALNWLDSKPFTTLFVPGNHENYDRLTGIDDTDVLNNWMYSKLSNEEKEKLKEGFPRKLWHGGMIREIRPSVLMLERGHIFNIDGCDCFAFGGARSHDISGGIFHLEKFKTPEQATAAYKQFEHHASLRVNHLSWWQQEMPNYQEMKLGKENLKKVHNTVDFIFSHDCPASDKTLLIGANKPDELNVYFEEIKQNTIYKNWFFGHYHDNKRLPGGKDILLYEQIVQIN